MVTPKEKKIVVREGVWGLGPASFYLSIFSHHQITTYRIKICHWRRRVGCAYRRSCALLEDELESRFSAFDRVKCSGFLHFLKFRLLIINWTVLVDAFIKLLKLISNVQYRSDVFSAKLHETCGKSTVENLFHNIYNMMSELTKKLTLFYFVRFQF
jgi:hypothetical protein